MSWRYNCTIERFPYDRSAFLEAKRPEEQLQGTRMDDSFRENGFSHMISEHQSEVLERISEYLSERTSLADVQNWLWPFLADLEDDNDTAARNAAGVIGSLISEYSCGDLTEDSMKRELAAVIRTNRSFPETVMPTGPESPVNCSS